MIKTKTSHSVKPWARTLLILPAFLIIVGLFQLFTQTRTADNFWNGGNFGFEGSVLSIVFQLIAIGGLWWYYNSKTKNSQEKEETTPLLSHRTAPDNQIGL